VPQEAHARQLPVRLRAYFFIFLFFFQTLRTVCLGPSSQFSQHVHQSFTALSQGHALHAGWMQRHRFAQACAPPCRAPCSAPACPCRCRMTAPQEDS
jgi:hypothetical protein